MGIIAKNIIIGNVKVVEEIPPPPKPITVFDKIRSEQNIVKQKPVVEPPVEKYHHVKDGELHKMYNKKSTYLSDMAAFEN
jgi:hypothetical protein